MTGSSSDLAARRTEGMRFIRNNSIFSFVRHDTYWFRKPTSARTRLRPVLIRSHDSRRLVPKFLDPEVAVLVLAVFTLQTDVASRQLSGIGGLTDDLAV